MKRICFDNPDVKEVDITTGEIKRNTKTWVILNNDEFIMLYMHNISYLNKLSASEIKVLFTAFKYSTYSNGEEGNTFTNDLDFKRKIKMEGFEITDNSVNVILTKLVQKRLLSKVCRGKYMLNPKYFYKGNNTDKTKLIFNIKTK